MLTFEKFSESYANVEMLARGGQKDVYSAVSNIYGSVVIKLFFDLDNPRSQREIEIVKQYQLESIPKVFETGQLIYQNAETLYMIEQRIEGRELREILSEGYRFSLKDAVSFLEQCLMFIMQLEANNIVHRDIKPENIIIDPSGKVFFLDFGIARVLGMPSLTKTEAFMGPHTPGYAAPEQFNNVKKDIDSRADLFSIGVVTYECITGLNPFREGAMNYLDILQRTETIIPVNFDLRGDSQKQFMALISSMMGKYPSRRPRCGRQAYEWLNAARPTFLWEEDE